MALLDFKNEDLCEAAILSTLKNCEISLTIGTDFREFAELVAEARPDHPLGDPFDPSLHDLNDNNACWIVGRDKEGQIMHLHALRLLPTEGASVAEYFRNNYLGFSPPELEIDVKRSKYRPCPAAKSLFGNVVYVGEYWVGWPPSQYRGVDLVGMLMRFAMLIALRRFEADYFLGFVTKPQANKGLALRFGFMHVDPFALRWYIPEKEDPLEGVMVYMSDEDMRYIMELPSPEVANLAA